jgi:capsule synthesis protein PGA_cap
MAPPRSSGVASRLFALAAVVALVGASCDQTPRPSPSAASTLPSSSPGPTGGPSVAPSPTPLATTAGPVELPLAVVTGLTNSKPTISMAELVSLADAGRLIAPCSLEVQEPSGLAKAVGGSPCVAADQIEAAIAADQKTVALVPPGLVEPRTKVLPITGDGPFGSGGPDLFGDAAARALPYPIRGRVAGGLPVAWSAYDPATVWTLTSLGGSCLDRNVAWQAIKLGKGWDWVMDGGTAAYDDIRLNPNTPAGVSRELVVVAHATGNRGAVAKLVSGADVTVDDFDCTVVPNWTPNYGRALVFSTSPDAVPLLRNKLGIDVMKVAGNHSTDKGAAGIRSTRRILGDAGILTVGTGMDLDEALEPVYMEVAGVKVAFVSWNAVPGSIHADTSTPGVAWLKKPNVVEGVRRAREAGAQVVICAPEWWGGAEYHMELYPSQERQLGWFDEAGCDQVLAHGTHLAGPMLLREPSTAGAELVMVSHGNFLFGQDWWQQVQEGVIAELAFRGPELVNVRLHPYIMLFAAQASLIDPETDGRGVLNRIWKHSDIAN